MLEQAVRAAACGRGRIVLVGGEAGIGKTSLVRALRAKIAEQVLFVVGACEPLSVPVPLGPVRELVEAAGSNDLTGLESSDRLVLARGVLAALTQRGSVVAVIEDAHWADPTTLDVIRLLAHRVEDQPLAIVVTYRDDEVAAHPELAQLLGDLATSPSSERLALKPLSESAVRELAEPAGIDAARLSRLTGGNPFLVVEAITAGERVPVSVRDATGARLRRLGPAGRGVVDAAAVIGQRVGLSLLEAVIPGSAPGVEEALAHGVLVAAGPAVGFRHELIREAVEASIPPPRRAELHRVVVTALARRAGGADHARLAHHAELADMSAEACHHAALAAAEARRVGAFREMGLQTERALRLGTDLSRHERFELLLQYSRAANFASARLEDAVGPAEEAIALAIEIRDPIRQGRAELLLSAALWSLDRVLESKAAAERAIAVLEQTGDAATLASAYSTYIRVEATAFDPAAAIASEARALELAGAAGLPETRIDVAISVGLARGHRGEPEGLAMLIDAGKAAREAGLPLQTVRTYVNLVFVGATLRQHAFVDTMAGEAMALFEGYGTTIPGHAIEIFRARSLLDRGRWDEAVAVAARPNFNWAAEAPLAGVITGLVAGRRGEPGATEALDRASEVIKHVPESSRHGTVHVAHVEAAWLGGDHTRALGHLHRARASPATPRFARSAGELALWAARCGLEIKAPQNAPPAVLMELAGDWRGAVRAWKELDSPYEAALAALPGDDKAAREALAALQRLGALGAARAFVRERAAVGAWAPRGPRRSTLANAAGLTRREQEVLEHLATGATNVAIGAALHLSERTVAHHVSAILGKLDAGNRMAAVEQARVRGLLPQDGPGPAPM